jgi:cysteine desulfurase / selenocysteine lyase
MNDYSAYFPYKKKNPDLIYFDNASTTQKPQTVITAVQDYLSNCCANPYRGSYRQALHTQHLIEETRKKAAEFINADPEEIFFTFGATDSIKKFTEQWKKSSVSDESEILYCPYDHQSVLQPFLNLQSTAALKPYGIFQHSGDADWRDILAKVSSKTKVIVITHIHSVYGLQAELHQLKGKLPFGTKLFLDATQSIGHITVDVQDLGIDAMVFSGHKLFALDGVGILYIKKDTQKMLAAKNLELGSLPVTGIISLQKAIEFIQEIGIDQIHQYCMYLTQYLLAELRKLPHIEFLPGAAFASCATGYGILSFRISGISSDDLAFILDTHNICVRSGNSCLHLPESVENSIRVSLHINNTKEEIDTFIAVLQKITSTL